MYPLARLQSASHLLYPDWRGKQVKIKLLPILIKAFLDREAFFAVQKHLQAKFCHHI